MEGNLSLLLRIRIMPDFSSPLGNTSPRAAFPGKCSTFGGKVPRVLPCSLAFSWELPHCGHPPASSFYLRVPEPQQQLLGTGRSWGVIITAGIRTSPLPSLCCPSKPWAPCFWGAGSGQPALQCVGCGSAGALGTLQLAPGEPSTSEIKDQVQWRGPQNKANQKKAKWFI